MQETYQHYIDINCCPRQNRLELFCCSFQCERSALICRDQKCVCQAQNHKTCKAISAPQIVDKILAKRKIMNDKLYESCELLRNIYDDAIERLSKDRETLDIWQNNYGLTQTEYKLLDLLTNKSQTITGKFINYVRTKLKIRKEGIFTIQQVKQNWQAKKQKFNTIFNNLGNPFRKFNFTIQEHLAYHPIPVTEKRKKNPLIDMAFKFQWEPLLQKLSNKQKLSKITQLQLIGSGSHKKNIKGPDIMMIQNFEFLKSLKKLSLMGNKILRIENLQSLKQIQWLHLGWNLIQKIQNLQELPVLSTLFLNYNQILKFQNLKGLKALKLLWIGGNPAAPSKYNDQRLQQEEGTIETLRKNKVEVFFM